MLTPEVLEVFGAAVLQKMAATHVMTIDPDDAKEYDRAMIQANSGNRRQGRISAVSFGGSPAFGKSNFGKNMGNVRFKDNYTGQGFTIPQGF